MIARLRHLIRCEKGSAAIELAMVAPVLAIMVAGVADISTVYGRELEIEQAAQRSIEKVMQTSGDDTPEDSIKREACMQINGSTTTSTTVGGVTTTTTSCAPGRITLADVTVHWELRCNGTIVADYDTECPTGQTTMRYVSTTVQDRYTPVFPLHFGTDSDGTYHISATAGVRVE